MRRVIRYAIVTEGAALGLIAYLKLTGVLHLLRYSFLVSPPVLGGMCCLYVYAAYQVRHYFEAAVSCRPPARARFLILLLMRGTAGDALIGDLEERFQRIARDSELGIGRARFWYWFQVFLSLRPLAWASLKRVTGLAAAYEAISKVLK